jgi:raffinose/stachyose/melibiose transport system substrate-binding protein
MKKLIALLLASLMAMTLLAACGGTPASTTDSGSGPAAPAGSADSAPAADNGDKATITIMYSGTVQENDFETETMPVLVEAKFPRLKLEVTKLPDEQYYTALKTKLASGEAPDMFFVAPAYAGSNAVISLAQAGYLEPITDLKIVELAGSSGTDAFTYDGKVYSVSSGASILGAYVNLDMFNDNNLQIPTAWDEFLNCCQVLKDAGITPIVMGDKDMYVMQFGLYQLAATIVYPANPSYDYDLRTGKTKFTDPGTWDAVLEMYAALYENGYVEPSSLGISQQQSQQMFIDGQAAMTFDGSWSAPTLRQSDFELGYFPLPATNNSADTFASVAPGGNLAIHSGGKHIEDCKAIMEYFYDGESDLFKAYVDADKSIMTYGYGFEDVNPLFQPFMTLYNEGKSIYWCNQAWPAGTESEMLAKFSELIGGQGTTVPVITEAMQMKIEELIAG